MQLRDQHIDRCMLSGLSGDAPFRDVSWLDHFLAESCFYAPLCRCAFQVVYVNDPKLSEMKQLLINMGYSAEFSSGVLYIGGQCKYKVMNSLVLGNRVAR